MKNKLKELSDFINNNRNEYLAEEAALTANAIKENVLRKAKIGHYEHHEVVTYEQLPFLEPFLMNLKAEGLVVITSKTISSDLVRINISWS